jgi:hypothetical protein
MEPDSSDLENLWDSLLSREPEQVRAAFARLEPGERQSVVAHLRRMAGESGWHPEQRRSAEAALEALDQV